MKDLENKVERLIMLTSPLFYVLSIFAYSYQGISWLWNYSVVSDWYFYYFKIYRLNEKELNNVIKVTGHLIKNSKYKKISKKTLIQANKKAKEVLKALVASK